MSQTWLRFVAISLMACCPIGATVDAYPTRPITLVVPFPAGGAIDSVARSIAEPMRRALGQPLIVENVAGASGSLATGRVAGSAPDGYTIGLGNFPTHVINGAVLPLKYDVVRDFEPVSLLTSQPLVIVAKKGLAAQSLQELINWLRASPDAALQGTAGLGSVMHLAGVLLQQETGTRFRFVPYRGIPTQELVAGHIDFSIDLAANALPHVQAGSVKAFAVASKMRISAAPDIPTATEAGLAGFQVATWFGLWLPRGAPAEIVKKINDSVVDALADGNVQVRLANLGQEIFPREQQTPRALAELQNAEISKWWPIIKKAGIKLN